MHHPKTRPYYASLSEKSGILCDFLILTLDFEQIIVF